MRTRTTVLAAAITLVSCKSYFDFATDAGAILSPGRLVGVTGDGGAIVDSGVESDSGNPSGSDGGPGDVDGGPGDVDGGPGNIDAGPPYDAGTSPDMTDAGTITVLASQEVAPQAIAASGGYVYFADERDPGYIARVPVRGGAPVTLTESQHSPVAIAANGTDVFWANVGTYSMMGRGGQTYNNDGAILKMAPAGGTTVTLASGQSMPTGIAVDSQNVYWTNSGTQGNDGTVVSVPIRGGTPSTLYMNQNTPTAIAVSPNSDALYWAVFGTVSGGNNYNNDGAILVGSTIGGSVTTLASGQSQPDAVAVDAMNVYWSDTGAFNPMQYPAPQANSGSIAYALRMGGTPVTLSSTEDWPTAITSDDHGYVYWLDTGSTQSNGSISRAETAGGMPELLVYAGINSFGLAVTSQPDRVFWTDIGSGMNPGWVNEFTPQ